MVKGGVEPKSLLETSKTKLSIEIDCTLTAQFAYATSSSYMAGIDI
jgi:hypothetical protein